MRFLARSLTGLFLLAVTAGLLTLAGSLIAGAIADRMAGKEPSRPAQERVFSANVLTITPERIVPELVAFGEIRSRRTLELRSARAGRIIELTEGFADGATVTAGQLLLRLDPADALSARDLALAGKAEAEADTRDAARSLSIARDDLAAAEAQLDLRRQALIRQEGLQSRGVGSAAAVETAALAVSAAEQAMLSRRSAVAQAEARVDQVASSLNRANIALAEAERALADTEIRASFDGRLNGVTLVEGRLVSANERLAEIIDPDALEVAFRLSTAQFARLADGKGGVLAADVRVTLDVLGAEIAAEGRVERVGASVGEGASGRLVYAALTDARGFRPGDFVTATIAEPLLDGVAMLPATAVSGDGQVLVLGTDDRLQVMDVAVLRRQGDNILIDASGLAGREVVAEVSPLLGAGIKVRPIRQGDSAAAVPSEPETVDLTPERRAELIAFVEANARMPADAKARVLEQLAQERVPAQVVARLEERMGG